MGDPANWYPWIELAAFLCGLIFGGFAVGSPSWVWLKRQLLTAPAFGLACLGTFLIGMSVWKSVQIEGPGFKAIIAELENTNQKINEVTARIIHPQTVFALREIEGTEGMLDNDVTTIVTLSPISMGLSIFNDVSKMKGILSSQGIEPGVAERISRDIVESVFHGSKIVDQASVPKNGITELKRMLIQNGYSVQEIQSAIDALAQASFLGAPELQDALGLQGSG
jgi:hypothetical protein